MNFENKVNIMTLTFIVKLKLMTKPTSIDIQKIDKSTLGTYTIALVGFSI